MGPGRTGIPELASIFGAGMASFSLAYDTQISGSRAPNDKDRTARSQLIGSEKAPFNDL